jgi:hypothetical protein
MKPLRVISTPGDKNPLERMFLAAINECSVVQTVSKEGNKAMKPFEYYDDVEDIEFHGTGWIYNELRKYGEELDLTPLTKAERLEKYHKREEELKAEAEELNKPFLAAHAALEEEFWKDLRKELGYDNVFTSAGVLIFESLVEDMYQCRRHLVEFDSENFPQYQSEQRYLQAKKLLQDYHNLRIQELPTK